MGALGFELWALAWRLGLSAIGLRVGERVGDGVGLGVGDGDGTGVSATTSFEPDHGLGKPPRIFLNSAIRIPQITVHGRYAWSQTWYHKTRKSVT